MIFNPTKKKTKILKSLIRNEEKNSRVKIKNGKNQF